ncbi:MAG: type IV toxin-antitoxin system AbiEi family antitoxin [bacterium]
MNVELDTIRRALEAAPVCKGLSWGKCESPSDPREGTFPADLTIGFNGKTYPVQIHVRRILSKVTIERVLALKKIGRSFLLVCEHITAPQADILCGNEIAFLDISGNAYLNLPGLQLIIVGKKKVVVPLVSDPGRVFHRAGIQVIFAFLADPYQGSGKKALLNQTIRTIQAQTGVALGSIVAILGSLTELGYVIEDENLRFLVNRKQLFEKWVAAYVERLRPKMVTRRYRSKGGAWWKDVSSLGEGNYWGGEVAAATLTGFLKPELATIYSRGELRRVILDADLRSDPRGDVEVLKMFWGAWPVGVRESCVHPLIVYADLIASEIDRNMETAQRVYERYLRDIIEPRG